MSVENRFQFAKNDSHQDIILLEASMRDFTFCKHAHEEYSFGITLAGRQDFFSLGTHHKSHAGNVMAINPGDAHDGHAGGSDTLRYKMLYVHPDKLAPMLKQAGIRDAENFRIKDTVQDNPVLQRHIYHLFNLVENPHTSIMAYSSALYEFALYLAQQEGIHEHKCYRHKDSALERAREYLHAHLNEELSLDTLSGEVNMSKFHFLRRFKDYFGMTPHQYWLNYRINRAKDALEAGMPLADIVFDHGFNDLSHLNRRFKPVYGKTPYQFQRDFLRGN